MPAFSDVWPMACKETSPNPDGAAGELMNLLGHLLDVEQVHEAQVGSAALFLFDLSQLGFSGMDLNVVMVSRPPASTNEEREQASLLSDYKHAGKSLGLCFHIILAMDLPSINPYLDSSLDAVLLCGNDLTKLFASPAPHAVFFEIIRRQVHLERLCPFNTTHEARGSMFRGRKAELKALTEKLDTNYVVSGARRIGKTSLLKRSYSILLNKRRQELRGRVFYFHCGTWGNYAHCLHRLAHEIEPRREARVGKGDKNITYMLERTTHKGARPLYLYFDELDHIVDIDSEVGWPFFNVLYEAASAGWIRVVFAGYRSMARLWKGQDAKQTSYRFQESPFYSKLEPVNLQPLNRAETHGLLQDGYRNVNIRIANEDQVLERIWQATAGYPFLVQFYGEQLFPKSSARSPQELRLKDVDTVEDDHNLKDLLETHFVENTIDHGRPAQSERICALLYAHLGNEPWTDGDFLEACEDIGHSLGTDPMQSICRALRNLHDAQILAYSNGHYSLAFPLLGKILRKAYPNLQAVLKSIVANR